ncbi:MAG TPA: GspMb/PilO family protein [Burkholderiales bacterium]|nr:GspMb/PilO family protein [Burkholderiales bacterium]
MLRSLTTVIERLGSPGKLALVLLAGTAIFLEAGLRPLEAQSERLDRSIERATKQTRSADPNLIRTASPSGKLAAFYRFFERDETTTDWLAKFYAIAEKSGLTLRTAEYQLIKGPGKLDRYEIALPLAGDYAQIRAFLENVLIEMPVLSLDQVSFRRKRTNDLTVETDVRLTLHILRP